MRVGIDGYNLALSRGTGISTYARGLSHCLGDLGYSVDAVYGLHLRAGAGASTALFREMQEEPRRRAPPYPSFGWAREMIGAFAGMSGFDIDLAGAAIPADVADRMPHFDRILNVTDLFRIALRYFRTFGRFVTIRIANAPAVMHWTYPLPIRLKGALNVYTIHDLVPLRMPEATLDHTPTHRRLLQTCIREGDHICTVSEHSRSDILDFFPELPPDRITNTYQAVVSPASVLDDGAAADAVRHAFGLAHRGYFLFFGSIEPKKNIGRLLQGYLASDLTLPLVLVGARAWKSENELAPLRDDPGAGRVRQIDYVRADMLVNLIRGARAVVFPSLYEGFGLPLLEAMSLGTPVLTSKGGATEEIGGDAALLVDPYDPQDISRGLVRLARDDTLCAALRVRGLLQAARFDMAQYRERVGRLYDFLVRR